MRIAIIGWGSLVWDPRDLPREGTWQNDGPVLPVEFSRISQDARLTLVVDTEHGTPITTMHVLSPRTSLRDAIGDLSKREQTSVKRIGWVDIIRGADSQGEATEQADVHVKIREWCQGTGYDGAVWTALKSNFKLETGTEFSVGAVLNYLDCLPKNVRKEALRYIYNAPDCVITPVREKVVEQYGERWSADQIQLLRERVIP